MRSKNPHKKIENHLSKIVLPFLNEGRFSHCYVGWGSWKNQEYSEFKSYEKNLYFDLASLTKPLCTLPLVLKYLKSVKIPLESSFVASLGVTDQLGFKELPKSISWASLLQHKSGLPSWLNFWMNRLSPESNVKSVNYKQRAGLVFDRLLPYLRAYPQVHKQSYPCVYSDVGYILLGVAIECLYRENLSVLFEKFSTEDLKVISPEVFFPQNQNKELFVPTSKCLIRGHNLVGEVHDENAAALGGICGHAGLFGSGSGLITHLVSFITSPLGTDLLNLNVELLKNTELKNYVLGWQKAEFSFVRKETHVLRHLGFTGTGMWLFPQLESYIVILTNRILSSRTSDWIEKFRNDVCEIIWNEDFK